MDGEEQRENLIRIMRSNWREVSHFDFMHNDVAAAAVSDLDRCQDIDMHGGQQVLHQ